MKCTEAISLFNPYLDGTLNGGQMHGLAQHFQSCRKCRGEYASLQSTQALLAALGRKPAPADLALRLRVAISQERSSSFSRRFQGLVVRVENALNAFMLPASAGLVTAVVMFGVLIGFLAVPNKVSANDVPTSLYMPPRLTSAPFVGSIAINSVSPVVIEAYIDSNGRISDYRIISGEDTAQVRKQLDRALIFTVFEPAMSFGRPAYGRVVITFSNVEVTG
jgi:anti-sigma factor RsiW